MTTVYIAKYEHDDSNSIELKADLGSTTTMIRLPNREVVHDATVSGTTITRKGVAADSYRAYRVVTLTCMMSKTDVKTLVSWLMPTSTVTYNTYPQLTYRYDSSDTVTFKCMIVGEPSFRMLQNNVYEVKLTFEERV